MKVGAENKKKMIWMTVLLVIAIPLAIYNFKGVFARGGASAATTLSAPVTPPPKTGGAAISADSDPRLRLDILEASRRVKYEPGRNIFEMQELKIETPLTNARNVPPNVHYGPDPLPPPPPPPPIPLKFYGFANKPGDPKKVFLQQQSGDARVFVAAQGDVIDRRYKVVQIQANAVVMEDMLTNNRQPIPLTPR